jgi:hypothetical protein
MNPWDHFPPYSKTKQWLLALLARALDGRGEWAVCASERGLILKHNGLEVCSGHNCHELKANYEAARGKSE